MNQQLTNSQSENCPCCLITLNQDKCAYNKLFTQAIKADKHHATDNSKNMIYCHYQAAPSVFSTTTLPMNTKLVPLSKTLNENQALRPDHSRSHIDLTNQSNLHLAVTRSQLSDIVRYRAMSLTSVLLDEADENTPLLERNTRNLANSFSSITPILKAAFPEIQNVLDPTNLINDSLDQINEIQGNKANLIELTETDDPSPYDQIHSNSIALRATITALTQIYSFMSYLTAICQQVLEIFPDGFEIYSQDVNPSITNDFVVRKISYPKDSPLESTSTSRILSLPMKPSPLRFETLSLLEKESKTNNSKTSSSNAKSSSHTATPSSSRSRQPRREPPKPLAPSSSRSHYSSVSTVSPDDSISHLETTRSSNHKKKRPPPPSYHTHK